jgi:hypothetical protein
VPARWKTIRYALGFLVWQVLYFKPTKWSTMMKNSILIVAYVPD